MAPDKEKNKIIKLDGKEVEVVGLEKQKNLKRGNIFIGTLNVFAYPARKALEAGKRRYDVRYKYNTKHLMFDIFLLAGIGVMIALNIFFFFFLADVLVDRTNLEINIIPEKVISGQDVTYSFKYANDNKFRIENVKVAIKFPKGFVFKESDNPSFNASNNTFAAGDLEPGGNGQTKIKGFIVGEVNKSQFVSATISYLQVKDEEGKVKKQRRKIFDKEYVISGTALETDLNLPAKAVNNQNFDFEIKYKNNSANDLSGVVIKPAWQEGFSIVRSEPALTDKGWQIGKLKAGQEGKISVTAHLAAGGELNKDFKVISIIVFNGDNLNQGEIIKTAEIIYPKFLVSQKINGQEDYSVKAGEDLEYAIFYKNEEDSDISNLKLEVELMGPYFDLNSIQAEAAVVEGNKIKWTQDRLARFAYIKKGQSGEVKFKIKLKPKVDIRELGERKENILLVSQVKASYKYDGQDVELIASRRESKLSSYLEIQAFGRYYYEGEQLGRGPLPPVVGEETKYWLFWNIANTTNKVKNVKVSAKLPANVSWTGEQGFSSDLKYNPANREVSWFINEINTHTGVIYPSMGAAFAVKLTPSASQTGKEPLLLKDIKISGEDEFTGQFLENYAANISTNLIYDERAKMKGTKVVKY